jgi:hypothetical protein
MLMTGWAKFSALVQTDPGTHRAPCTKGTGSLSRGGSGMAPPSSTEVKERVSYATTTFLGLHILLYVETSLLTYDRFIICKKKKKIYSNFALTF